jgi:Family of unknown function (DUF6338)
MPDLSIEKLIFFLFAVLPGFIAMQVYGLKCPTAKRDWGNSLVEVITYSLTNLTIWLAWVLRIVRTPFKDIDSLELTAAVICVCFVSPILLSLGWYWLRTTFLHKKLKMDHPTPRGWDHFVKIHPEYWVLFHWKNGKVSGGYFGGDSYASTFPQEPEIYVEEMWRVDDRGEFTEMVEGTLGGVIRISECERVEFLRIERGECPNGLEKEGNNRATSTIDRGQTGGQTSRPDGLGLVAEQRAETTEGRVVNGSSQPVKVTESKGESHGGAA